MFQITSLMTRKKYVYLLFTISSVVQCALNALLLIFTLFSFILPQMLFNEVHGLKLIF